MPTAHSLPDNPNLDWLRQRARALQRAVRAGDPDAVARVASHHPGGGTSLSTAQLVIAREYGFRSWPRLRHYLDLAADHGWDATAADRPAGGPADELCRLACLTYQVDEPQRREQARRLLADHPELTRDHIWAAAAAAQPAAVDRLLAADPALVRQRGGPYGWTPLFYLAYSRAYSRLDADGTADLAVARSLLAAGADPDEGYLWNGRPYPFTVLTGVFGEGELGPQRQPRHPHSIALARLLLEAGANPNDSQALYNRQFGRDDDHLVLLFEYGLGRDADYPWRERLGDLLDRPAGLLRIQLRWAVEHNLPDRVRLLVRHGVDVRSRYRAPADTVAWLPDDGYTAAELAARCGNAPLADFLASQGSPLRLDPADALIAAALRADRGEVERLRAAHPAVVEQVRTSRPGLIVWAAGIGRTRTVALLAELGFDVNARGRGDVPVEGGVDTALHYAAYRGDLPTARLLLSLGADPTLVGRFDATPLGWAEHAGHQSMVELLAPLT
jgi:ankyrin repeat protein